MRENRAMIVMSNCVKTKKEESNRSAFVSILSVYVISSLYLTRRSLSLVPIYGRLICIT